MAVYHEVYLCNSERLRNVILTIDDIHENQDFERLLEGLVESRFLTRKLVSKLDVLRKARNFAVYHDALSGTEHPDWAEALEIAKGVITGLNKAIEAGYSVESEERVPVDIESDSDVLG